MTPSPILLLVGFLLTVSLVANGLIVLMFIRCVLEDRRQLKRDEVAARLLEEFARADAWQGFDEARARYEVQQKAHAGERS